MMDSLECVATLLECDDRLWDVSWHPQGHMLAACGADKIVYIWGYQDDNWTLKGKLTDAHSRTVRSVAWSPNGKLLASASFDGTIAIWDRSGGEFECNVTLEGHENEVKCVSWSRSGNFLATCGRDKSVWVWETGDGDEDFECAAVLTNHTQDVKKVIWHPNEDILVSVSYDNTIKLYAEDGDEWICRDSVGLHESTVWSCSYNADGNQLATCSDDKTVKIWKKYDGWKCICMLSGYHSLPVYSIDWWNSLLVTGCGDNAIRIFRESSDSSDDVPVWDMIYCCYNAHSQDVNCVSWNPARKNLLASVGDDGKLKLWQFKDGVTNM